MNHEISPERKLKYLSQYIELYIDQLPGKITLKPFEQWLESTIDKKAYKAKKQYEKKLKQHCIYCRRSFEEYVKTKDHIVALSLGGLDKKENRIRACKDCNEWKGAKTLQEWLSEIKKLLKKQRVYKGYTLGQLGFIKNGIEKLLEYVKEHSGKVSTYKPK